MSNLARGSTELTATKIDSEGRSWIEVMPTAEKAKNGPWYFTITADDLDALANYIEANPERIQIDRDHKASDGDTRAAGWFTGQASVVAAGAENPNGETQEHASAWAEVKWTPLAVKEIRDGEFRFISPEWQMAETNPKSGLMTKFKELAAATLTNRPYFKNLSPVTAADLLDSDQLDALSKRYGSEAGRLVLAGLEGKEAIDALLKTSQEDEVNAELAKALGLPEDADEKAVLAKVAELKDAAPAADDNEGETVADKPAVTDYMKILGLDETADPKHRLAAAFRDKDEKILALETELTDQKAKLEKANELEDSVKKLEARDRQRDIAVILDKATLKGRVLPAEKEKLAELFANDVDGLRSLIATRPAEFFGANLKPLGVTGDKERYSDDADVAAYVKKNFKDSKDPVDTESAKQHLQAMEILKERGKENDYTPDDYVEAYSDAAALV